MNLSIIVSITVSLIFFYLIFSLVASEIQELLTTILEWRAKHLRESIANLLGEENSGDPLIQKLYNNSLIRSLNQKDINRAKSIGPSYITSEIFSIAFLETIKNVASYTTDNLDIDSLINHINNSDLPDTLKENFSVLTKLTTSKVKEKEKQLEQLEKEISNWYDRSMERATGVYKRNAKAVALIVAFFIAIAANVDTVYIVKSLAQDKIILSTISQVSEQFVTINAETASCITTAEDKEGKTNCLAPITNNLNFTLEQLAPLPIGWDLSEPFKKQFRPFNFQSIVETMVGWVLSAIAISMGAAFWFDLLRKVLNIRNTGKKPTTNK
ncbi:MAG: hypothetical protein F6K16_23365 [Symploca sp. SIO2B6]|nr:hypothetical protein [Symploca sp. SIO2B6]